MREINIVKASIAVGIVFAAWHAMWVTMVGEGWAAGALNFILKLHFLKIDVQLAPYDVGIALALITFSFGIGALLGAVFAVVWNWLTLPAASRASGKKLRPSTRAN